MRHFLRHPKTTQERRASLSGYGRSKRIFSNLPSAWDDLWRKDCEDRRWKRSRKTQYQMIDKFPIQKKNSNKYALSMAKRDRFHLDHKLCHWEKARCKYCIKNHIWDKYDKYMNRKRRKYLKKQQEENSIWWRILMTS